MDGENRLIYGVGINDADYVVQPTINGKREICPFYRLWFNMIKRCYSMKYQVRYPTYIGCSVCDEWLTFLNFKAWVQTQNWEGKELDKDLLLEDNKVYSPETCIFVDHVVNTFTLNRAADRGNHPIGVDILKHGGFRARCNNPFSGKSEYLGQFTCPNQAHEAWRKRKHELACQLADLQSDDRVADALRMRYWKDEQKVIQKFYELYVEEY